MSLPSTSFLWVALAILSVTTVAQELLANFTIDSVSPFLHSEYGWELNETTSYLESVYMRTNPRDLVINFIANGFKLFGAVTSAMDQPLEGDIASCTINGNPPELAFANDGGGARGELFSDAVNVTIFYTLGVNIVSTTEMEFHNLTFQIPVQTEA